MKKLDFYFKPNDASSTKSFDTSQAGVSDSLPESLPSPLDSQKPKVSTHMLVLRIQILGGYLQRTSCLSMKQKLIC